MRLSEAFEIEGEEKEKGCRYVIVGKKTEQSLRRVPLSTALLPFLPKTIMGPLFPRTTRDPPDAASKRLNRFLDDVASRTRARWFIRCGTVRKIGCAPLVARKMYVGRF